MKTITVTASRQYEVRIGSNLLSDAGQQILQVCQPKNAVIISDSNVAPLYADAVSQSLQSVAVNTFQYVFPAGEASKTLETFCSILNFLAENRITRSDVLIALGGGVVGDITGFAAACYLRGIAFVQIPTTLLAMVDSSVGGKTAVDLPAGKNLAGAFYQPALVLCDTNTLSTLPDSIFREGCAEVIKYGVLYDQCLFSVLSEKVTAFDRESVIARCVELKRDVVAKDEFDTGERQMLNLGHTVGHAIEKLSGLSVSHGAAVAAGMAIIARAASSRGDCSLETASAICKVLSDFGLPTKTPYSASEIAGVMLSDKKRFADTVNLILPRKIGSCAIFPTPVDQLESFIQAGL